MIKSLKLDGHKEHHLAELATAGYHHIAHKIEIMWETTELNDYFHQIVIDHRGNRSGFPQEVFTHIMRLFVLHNVDNDSFKLDPWILTNLR